MPDSLVSLLKTGVGYHHLEGVVPVVAQLLQESAATRHAYLCHPWVQHISKLRKEGMLRSSIGLPTVYHSWLKLPQVVFVGTATFRCSVPTSPALNFRGTTASTAAFRPSFRSKTTLSRPGMLASTHRAASRRAGSRGRESILGPPRFVFLPYGGLGPLLTAMIGLGHVPPPRYTVGTLSPLHDADADARADARPRGSRTRSPASRRRFSTSTSRIISGQARWTQWPKYGKRTCRPSTFSMLVCDDFWQTSMWREADPRRRTLDDHHRN